MQPLSEGRAILSAEDHQHFIEHGYVVVRDIVPLDLVARTVAMLESAEYVGGPPGFGAYRPVDDQGLIAECLTERLQSVVRELFGAAPFTPPSRESVILRPREHQPEEEWRYEGPHVDYANPTLPPDAWALGMFVALTRVRSHGGAFMCAAGSPRRFRAIGSRRGSESIWAAALDELGGPLTEHIAEPGDAIVFGHLMCHSGSINTADPQTRHVLDVRVNAQIPLAPGDRPFEEMSTLEKANSMRYLASMFVDGFVLPAVADDDVTASALSAGFGADSSISRQVAFRWGDATYIAHTTTADPETVAISRTTDWVTWEPMARFDSLVGRVHSLNFDARYGATLTVAGESTSVVLTTEDLTDWRTITRVDGARLLRQGYLIADQFAKAARYQVCYYLDPANPNHIRWKSPTKEARQAVATGFKARQDIGVFEDLPLWPADGQACALPEGAAIDDAAVMATRDGPPFALVADVGGTPVYETSQLADDFTGDLKPLNYDTTTPPRRVRIYERGSGVWLVTFLLERDEKAQVHWGLIDWTVTEPGIRQIRTGTQLRHALGLVGLL